MKKKIISTIMTSLAVLATGCLFKAQAQAPDGRGLKDYYKNYFTIGVAVSPRALQTDEAGLITKEFNSLTGKLSNQLLLSEIFQKVTLLILL